MALNWETAEPCIVENGDTGEMFYGDTDTPIKEFLSMDEAHNRVLSYCRAADEDMLADLLKHIGYNTITRDGEFIILEDKK